MNEGWIKLHRQLKEWQHYQEPFVLLVWLDLLLSANMKAGWVRGNRINRGQLITSVARIMESTGIGSDNTVRDALRKLEESGEIKREQIGVGTKITINHFNKFQTSAQDAQPSAQPTAEVGAYPSAEVGAQPTAQPGADKQEYIEREESKERKEEKNIYTHTHYAREGEKIGIFQNVILSASDLETIRMNFATEGLDDTFLNRCVDKLSSYMAQNGTHYTNHAAAILSWVKAAVLEEDRRTGKAQPKPAAYSSKAVSPEAEHERKVRELKQLWDAMSDEDKRITIELEGMPMYENPKYIERQ